jgi:hypothetical protein
MHVEEYCSARAITLAFVHSDKLEMSGPPRSSLAEVYLLVVDGRGMVTVADFVCALPAVEELAAASPAPEWPGRADGGCLAFGAEATKVSSLGW